MVSAAAAAAAAVTANPNRYRQMEAGVRVGSLGRPLGLATTEVT